MMCLDLPMFNFRNFPSKNGPKKIPETPWLCGGLVLRGWDDFSGHKSPAVGVIAKTVLLGKGGVTVTNLVGL